MDKQSILTLVLITIVSIAFGPVAATVLIFVLIGAGFLLTFLLRAVVGANVPAGLSHKVDQLTLFFLYSAMTRHSSGTAQPMLQAGSDRAANMQFMRRLRELPPFRLVSDVVAVLGPLVCYPAYTFFNWLAST
jgi:hypothetical protein